MPPKIKYPCIICRAHVKENEAKGSIACCVCRRWVHVACTTMHPETVKWFLELEKIQGHHFYSCDGCSIAFSSLNKRMTKLDSDLKNVQVQADKNTIAIGVTDDKVEVLEKNMEQVK